MKLHKKLLVPLLAAVLGFAASCTYQQVLAQSTANIVPSTSFGLDTSAAQNQPPVDVNINIRVQHNLKAIDVFTAFPYPVKPPPITVPVNPISTNRSDIERDLMGTCYVNRSSKDTTWSGFGWRWRYAVEAAMQKSGIGYPHSILEIYSWKHEMAPYVLPFIIRINATEKNRSKRYDQAVDFYDNNGLDLENEATRNGYSSVPLSMVHNQAHVKLTPGNWWITGRHKVTGLIYYWQAPITIKPGQPVNLDLTEWNALIVQGTW